MSDKIRGVIAILVGVFALWQSYSLYQTNRRDWHMWVEVVAGVVLIIIGSWRVQRRTPDPTSELLK